MVPLKLVDSSAPPPRQEARRYAEVGYMDREQFRKMFDQLDKDCIKEVDLCLVFVSVHLHVSN